jgi:predicted nucleic acid-binding Zn ribbon protein
MPTYIYETIPAFPDERPERFEVRQSMMDPPLKRHPETGVPVRRIITGGLDPITPGAGARPAAPT